MAAPTDASGVEAPENNDVSSKKTAKKGVLGAFSRLADASDEAREKAVVAVVAQLARKTGDETSTELEYSVERLVRGLASSNKAARLGYYVALVEILRKFEDRVETSHVLQLISKHLADEHEKQEINPLIAMVFAYGALIRSERLSQDAHSLRIVCEELLGLYSLKDFLQELCATFLVEIFERVEAPLFAKHAWPSLQSHFTGGWSSCTPDTLWMMLVLSQTQKAAVDDTFLANHWSGKKLLAVKNFPRIAEICLSSSKGHPRIHPVCKYILGLLGDTKHFSEFWKTLVEAAMVKQHKEKLYLVFELLKESFEHHLTTSERVSELLLPGIVRVFVTNLAHSVMLLHGAAAQLAETVKATAIRAEDGAVQFEILKCLLVHPGTVMFDQVTRTPTIARIIPHLKPEATTMLITLLRSIFSGSPNKRKKEAKAGEQPITSEAHRAAALHMLTQLTVQSSTGQGEALKDALRYFSFHAFFNQLGKSKDVPQCHEAPVEVSQNLHDVSRDCFYRLLSVSAKRAAVERGSGSTLLRHHCGILDDALRSVGLLLRHPEVAVPCSPLSDEAHAAFLKVLKKAAAAEKLAQGEGLASRAQAFQVLFLNLGLQLFVDEKHTLGILEDLYVCYDKAFAKKAAAKKSQKAEDEPQWIEVVVDLLLSLLSKNSQVLRVVANNVFLLLVPHFTASALQQILDVIDPSRDEDDDSVMEDESGAADGSAESESSGSESDDGDEVDDKVLALKRSVKEALGDAAEDSDDENEVETYMDDAAMERVDESLAQAFRSMHKKKLGLSTADEALLHFRNRCLDVLGLIISSRPVMPFIMPSLLTALSALEFGYREKHQEPLAASATACLKRLFGIRKDEDSSDADTDFKDILSQLIGRFKTVSDHKLFTLIADACTFVFRCALHCGTKEANQEVESCVAVYKDSVRDYVRRSDCHIPERLFTGLINLCLLHGWEMSDVLLECAFDDTIRLFKRSRALTLMTFLTSQPAKVRQVISEKQLKTLRRTCVPEICKGLEKMMSTELKQNTVGKMLKLAANIVSIDEEAGQEAAEYGTLLTTIAALADKGLPKESKKCIGRITKMLTKSPDAAEKRSNSSPEKKSKKLKVV